MQSADADGILNAMDNAIQHIPELNDEFHRTILLIRRNADQKRSVMAVLWHAVIMRRCIRRDSRNMRHVLELADKGIRLILENSSIEMDSFGRRIMANLEGLLALSVQSHKELSVLCDIVDVAGPFRVFNWMGRISRCKKHERVRSDQIAQIQELLDECRQNWPWLNRDRIRESRKEYAEAGGVELSEIIRDGSS